MTINSSAKAFGLNLPEAGDRDAAVRLRQILASSKRGDHYALHVPNRREGGSAEVVLSAAMADIMLDLLRHISSGRIVTLVPTSENMTTQQAADVLNVSRPYLIKLLESGTIPFEKVNRHRRIKASDLFSYKNQRDQQRAEALERLAGIDSDLI